MFFCDVVGKDSESSGYFSAIPRADEFDEQGFMSLIFVG
jgi:hypothetical protein